MIFCMFPYFFADQRRPSHSLFLYKQTLFKLEAPSSIQVAAGLPDITRPVPVFAFSGNTGLRLFPEISCSLISVYAFHSAKFMALKS